MASMVVRQLWPLKHSTILAEGCHAPRSSRERRYVETHCTVSSFPPDLVAYHVIEFHVLRDRGRGRHRALAVPLLWPRSTSQTNGP